jgi:hypothetical protein
MMHIRIQCGCGQPYSFEVEPANGVMPHPVQCPVCGADGTAAANQHIAGTLASSGPPPATPPGLRVAAGGGPPPVRREFTANEVLMDSCASNPGRMRLDLHKAMVSHPGDFLPFGALVLVAIAALLFIPLLTFLAVAVAGILMFRFSRVMKAKFMDGDLCPGVVVSAGPPTVAVFTNMAADGGFKPAVKILRQPLHRMPGGCPPAGTRVATVALYNRPVMGGAWRDFMPDVIDLCAADPAEAARARASIPEREWQRLEQHVAQIQNPAPGLHRFWGAHAGRPVRSMKLAWQLVTLAAILVPAAVLIGVAASSEFRRHRGARSQVNVPSVWSVFRDGARSKRPAPGESTAPSANTRPATRPSAPASGSASKAEPQPPSTAPATGATWKAGDKVEVLWGGKWWPSSVIQTDGARTKIHYDGWAAIHDEWVTPDRIRRRP